MRMAPAGRRDGLMLTAWRSRTARRIRANPENSLRSRRPRLGGLTSSCRGGWEPPSVCSRACSHWRDVTEARARWRRPKEAARRRRRSRMLRQRPTPRPHSSSSRSVSLRPLRPLRPRRRQHRSSTPTATRSAPREPRPSGSGNRATARSSTGTTTGSAARTDVARRVRSPLSLGADGWAAVAGRATTLGFRLPRLARAGRSHPGRRRPGRR